MRPRLYDVQPGQEYLRKAGCVQMPGSGTMRSPLDGKRWYHANNPSPAVPTGLGDEEAIRAIWAGAAGTGNTNDDYRSGARRLDRHLSSLTVSADAAFSRPS